jgi:hypothetical protein
VTLWWVWIIGQAWNYLQDWVIPFCGKITYNFLQICGCWLIPFWFTLEKVRQNCTQTVQALWLIPSHSVFELTGWLACNRGCGYQCRMRHSAQQWFTTTVCRKRQTRPPTQLNWKINHLVFFPLRHRESVNITPSSNCNYDPGRRLVLNYQRAEVSFLALILGPFRWVRWHRWIRQSLWYPVFACSIRTRYLPGNQCRAASQETSCGKCLLKQRADLKVTCFFAIQKWA